MAMGSERIQAEMLLRISNTLFVNMTIQNLDSSIMPIARYVRKMCGHSLLEVHNSANRSAQKNSAIRLS